MPYQVLLGLKAERAFRRPGVRDKERIRGGPRQLETDPLQARSGADIERLRGTTRLYRIRIGEWRAVYGIDGRDVIVTDHFRRGAGYDV